MAIKGTLKPDSSQYFSRVNSTNNTVQDRSLPSSNETSGEDWSALFNSNNEPFGLGDGVTVDSDGMYIMPPNAGPVQKFLVINTGPNPTHVGINNEASGQWNTTESLVLASGESFEFGAESTQIIRNVWAETITGTSDLRGYATNISSINMGL